MRVSVLTVAAFVPICACSLLVDTTGLGGRAEGDASAGNPGDGGLKDGSSSTDGSPSTADASSKPDGPGTTCASQGASCAAQPCCAGLQCGDARECLTCLPKYDDCTSGAQCCSGSCASVTEICD